jgi:uncharacterized protein involved in exopolysaccharide biosynthesis
MIRNHYPENDQNVESSISILDLIEPIFAQKWFITKFLLGCLFAGWLLLLVCPRTYQSEAKLLLRVGRESVALDPTATTSQTMTLQKTQEEEVNSALEVMKSRFVAEEIVREIGAANVLNGSFPGKGKPSGLEALASDIKSKLSEGVYQTLLFVGLKDELSEEELAVMKIEKSLNVSSAKKSTVLHVAASSKSPEIAKAIVETANKVFLEQHLSLSSPAGSQEFFNSEVDSARSKLSRLQNERRETLQKLSIASIESKRVALSSRISRIESEILTTSAELQQAESEIEDLVAKIADSKDEIIAQKSELSDPTWSGMRARLYELEIEERSQSSMLKEDHPRLIAIRNQLEDTRMILSTMQSERVNENMTPNPAKLRMQEKLQVLQTKVVGFKAMLAAKTEQHDTVQREIKDLLKYELDLDHIERQIGVASNSLALLSGKKEEARVIDQLRRQSISNISVVQPATYIERPQFPPKKPLAALFLLAGLGGGVALALLKESTSTRLRTSLHVTRQTNYPVVSVIPASRRKSVKSFVDGELGEGMRKTSRQVFRDIIGSSLANSNQSMHAEAIGVVGVNDGCGASTIASALAMGGAEGGMSTVLLDGDSELRTIEDAFVTNGALGLTELSKQNSEYDDVHAALVSDSLRVIPFSGRATRANVGELDEHATSSLLGSLRRRNGLVVMDLPSGDRPQQLLSLVDHLDQVVVVIESEHTDSESAQRLLQHLEQRKIPILGIVVNKRRKHLPSFVSGLLS